MSSSTRARASPRRSIELHDGNDDCPERAPLSDSEVRSARSASAALGLAIALFGLAWPRPVPEDPACVEPRESRQQAGHTVEVHCGRSGGSALRGPARMLFGLAIDPNRADARTLEVLPGIGPARAAAILAERERRPFERISDLERVAGIGPATRHKLAPWLGLPSGAPVPRNR